YCGSGCQNNCGAVLTEFSNRTCQSSTSSDRRTIGYYSSDSSTRSCDSWLPEDIDPFAWTHINYAFAIIDSNFSIAAANSYDEDFYRRTSNLKVRNPALKVYISVGGWGAGGEIFSNMVSNTTSRDAFITSAIKFMKTYAFDGIDIDWEYPAASDRGGTSADTANYVLFLEELRSACSSNFGITLTLPISYWYLKGFDITGLESYVDWFNFMSYDIHGTWDGDSPGTQAVVQAHTNLTEISQGLELLWRNNISPSKVVMGLGFYGRSFTLKNGTCNSPGCPFSGGGNPGQCTGTSGTLSNAEIASIIHEKGITATLDEEAAVKYITWDDDQWVSYDDWETYNMKKEFANKLCLGGTMAWSLDLEEPSTRNSSMSLAADRLTMPNENLSSNPSYYQARFAAHNLAKNYEQATFWTDCRSFEKPQCPVGYKVIAYGHGKVFDADQGVLRGDGCHGGGKGWNRALCAPSNFQGRCEW
ncbi:glycoside hydrolase family 18 protein, partial [Saccharata proteae CBS 121410]